MNDHSKWDRGKSVAEADRNVVDAGKSNNTEVQEIEGTRSSTEELQDYRHRQKRRCVYVNDDSVSGKSLGDEDPEPRKGLECKEMESDTVITRGENSGITGSEVKPGEENDDKSCCDPLEYISEVWSKYEEHCAFVEANPDCYILKLSLEEFIGQTDADENEFGPSDTLETIWLDIIHAPLPFEERIRLWKQRHNRFVEVEWKKKKREEEAERPRQ